MNKTFKKDNGQEIPVSDSFLLPFLTPTSSGTHFRDSVKEADLFERQHGRVLLQLHQILSFFQSFGIDLKGKSLLDIGTGNGLIPRMLLELTDLKNAVGADPFLDGEHPTSWQKHDHDKAIQDLRVFLEKHCQETIDWKQYNHLLKFENYSLIPAPVPRVQRSEKPYRFAKVGAHDLHQIDQKFDLFYCKAIEHISDWNGVFQSIAAASEKDAVIYLKHRSFFSYLGPHRFASINIPWGHLLLTDKEYKRFVEQFFPDQAAKMINFYFESLTYPRMAVSQMVQVANKHGFIPVAVLAEPPRYMEQVAGYAEQIPHFWETIHENYPHVPAEEVFSGMYHILFRKSR